MKYARNFLYLFFLTNLIFISCDSQGYDNGIEGFDPEYGFTDGTYCADVDYYNPNTGTRSSYQLNVEVVDNYLVRINFTRGWLDEDQFGNEELDEDGYCAIVSDKEYEYDIQITGPECDFNDASSASSQHLEDQEAITCPKCGDEKHDYDELCDECEDEEEHTCSRCGNYDSFMFSSDDYCSECANEVENTCSSCGAHAYYVYGGLCDDCEEEGDY